MMADPYTRVFNENVRTVDLTEFHSDASGNFYFHVFCTLEQGEGVSSNVPQPVYVDLVHNLDTQRILTINPTGEWMYYHVRFTTPPLNDLSFLEVQIYHDASTGNHAKNYIRRAVIEHVDNPATQTFTSFLTDYDFSSYAIGALPDIQNGSETEWQGQDARITDTPINTSTEFYTDPTPTLEPEDFVDISLNIPFTLTNNVAKITRLTYATVEPRPQHVFIFMETTNTDGAQIQQQVFDSVDIGYDDVDLDLSFAEINLALDNNTTNYYIRFTSKGTDLVVNNLKLFGVTTTNSNEISVYNDPNDHYYIHPYLILDTNFNDYIQLQNFTMTTNVIAEQIEVLARTTVNTDFTVLATYTTTAELTSPINKVINSTRDFNDFRFRIKKAGREISASNVTMSGLVDHHYKYEWIRETIRMDNYVILDSNTAKIQQRVPINTTYQVAYEDAILAPTTGTTYTYTNTGTYRIDIDETLGSQHVDVVDTTFEVTRAAQTQYFPPLVFSGLSSEYIYNPVNKDIKLDVSNGYTGGTVSFDASGGSVTGNTFTYENAGTYTIMATMDGSLNYFDQTISQEIIVQKADQSNLFIGDMATDVSFAIPSEFVLDVSGGSDEAYTVRYELVSGSDASIVDNKLLYTNVGMYTIKAIRDGGANYNDISFSFDIDISNASQDVYYPSFQILNAASHSFDAIQPSLQLEVSGGYPDGAVSFSIPGQSIHGQSITNGNVWNYSQTGTYTVTATRSGEPNFFDTTVTKDINVVKGDQAMFYFLNFDEYLYNPTNKSIPLKALGGSGDGDTSYSLVSGNAAVVTNDTLTYTNTGVYIVKASKAASANFLLTEVSITLTVVKIMQPPLSLSNVLTFVYDPSQLAIILDGSGGASEIANAITYSGIGQTNTVVGNVFSYTEAGTYRIQLAKQGNQNYYARQDPFVITIEKRPHTLDKITTNVYYQPNKKSDRLSDLIESSAQSEVDPIVIVYQAEGVDISDNEILYEEPGTTFTLHASHTGTRYTDEESLVTYTVQKKPVTELYDEGLPVRPIYRDPYYTVAELDAPKKYTLMELIQGGVTLRELRSVGYQVCEVYATGVYTVRDLERAGYRLKYCIR
jgi:hypothetical protein